MEAQFDVIPRRRYTLVAERLSELPGDRTARWFYDTKTASWYTAESWKRPNFLHRLNEEQVAYVESLIGPGLICPDCGRHTVTVNDDGSRMCGHCYVERYRSYH